jgi:endonuclease-3
MTEHHSEVPRNREALEALPGVGRKTANVVMNTAFGEPTIAVDTHIFRVSNRTGIAPGKNVDIVEQKLMKFVPKEFRQDAHHWLILHGRYTCIARKPKCWNCMIADCANTNKKRLYPIRCKGVIASRLTRTLLQTMCIPAARYTILQASSKLRRGERGIISLHRHNPDYR